MANIVERRITNGDVELQVREGIPAGGADPSRPPVLLVHGWPEDLRSWRHQVEALTDAGWHTVAFDLRGFGRSSAPADLSDYRIDHVASDVLAVIDDLGAEKAVLFGHDWGSMVVWQTGLLHPERCAGVVGMSVPFTLWPMPPTELMRMAAGDRFLYILYFQTPGIADAELDADIRRSLRMTYWSASAGGLAELPAEAGDREPGAGLASSHPMEGTGFLDTMREPAPGPMSFLDQDEEDAVVADYSINGFRGGLNYYRSFDANFEVTKGLDASRLSMPTAFIGGAQDVVVMASQAAVDAHATTLPDFRGNTLIQGAGHWVQNEAVEETNAAMLAFLARLG